MLTNEKPLPWRRWLLTCPFSHVAQTNVLWLGIDLALPEAKSFGHGTSAVNMQASVLHLTSDRRTPEKGASVELGLRQL